MLICQAAAVHMVTIPRDAAGADYSDVHTCQDTCYKIIAITIVIIITMIIIIIIMLSSS